MIDRYLHIIWYSCINNFLQHILCNMTEEKTWLRAIGFIFSSASHNKCNKTHLLHLPYYKNITVLLNEWHFIFEQHKKISVWDILKDIRKCIKMIHHCFIRETFVSNISNMKIFIFVEIRYYNNNIKFAAWINSENHICQIEQHVSQLLVAKYFKI